jgi:hypothetical protein
LTRWLGIYYVFHNRLGFPYGSGEKQLIIS